MSPWGLSKIGFISTRANPQPKLGLLERSQSQFLFQSIAATIVKCTIALKSCQLLSELIFQLKLKIFNLLNPLLPSFRPTLSEITSFLRQKFCLQTELSPNIARSVKVRKTKVATIEVIRAIAVAGRSSRA